MQKLKWRIYYGDGATLDNSQGLPKNENAFGVICIVQGDVDDKDNHDRVGRTVTHFFDFYYFVPSENRWYGADIHGLLDRILNRFPAEYVCAGRTVSNTNFKRIMDIAHVDPDFLPKSAIDKLERPKWMIS